MSIKSNIYANFLKQVSVTPYHVAIEHGKEKITYKDLKYRIDICAHIINSNLKCSGNSIGVCMEKSIHLIVVIFAIMKTKNIYVPLDSSYPDERLGYIMKDSEINYLFLDKNSKEKNIFKTKKQLFIDSHYEKETINYSFDNSIAYIMYTSGTTGLPKGVLTTHNNILSRTLKPQYLKIFYEDKILWGSNYCFDASSFEIFTSLLNGATLVIPIQRGMQYLYKLPNIIEENNITVCFLTTSLFNVLAEGNLNNLKKLRVLLFGGEKASVSHANLANQNLKNTKIVHVYGPTESTIFATYHVLNKNMKYKNNIPIGKPIDKTTVQISPKNKELLISGEGVSLGYLNNKKITDEKFTFYSNDKIYRTGDRVEYNSKGELLYEGRIDNQVKIRGFRVELEEVEKVLENYVSIKEACVTCIEDKLIAFVRTDNELDIEDIYIYLNKKLPNFTVPSILKEVSSFPLNSNGKVDKKKLIDLM